MVRALRMSSAPDCPNPARRTAVTPSDSASASAWAGAGAALAASALYLAFGLAAVGMLAGVLPLAWLMLHEQLRLRQARLPATGHPAGHPASQCTDNPPAEAAAPDSPARAPLESLANRIRFGDRLAQAIVRCRRQPGYEFAVMYLEFDRFKLINDTLGADAGDRFLSLVAQRIRAQAGPGDTVGWLGADEFAILVDDLGDAGMLLAMAERLHRALAAPHALDGTEVGGCASIGITLGRVGYDTPGDVLRDADIALARAKAAGRGCTAIFDTGSQAPPGPHPHLERDLRRALEQALEQTLEPVTGHAAGQSPGRAPEQLGLVFQPIYDLASGRAHSFEALIRWQHPERGLVPPDTFIPVAAQSVLMDRLTDWVLARACAQLRVLQRGVAPGTPRPRLHVNIAGSDLARPGFVSQVAMVLLVNGLDPAQLTLEIAETLLLQRVEGVRETMGRLRELGVGLAVDQLGTGYSSLAHLSTLPLTSLKIDRSFVQQLGTGPQDAEVLRGFITLGQALGRTVIAEGIETPAQLARLRELGCVLGQGYLLARPRRAPQDWLYLPWQAGEFASTASPEAALA
jgi:diguanylate cyclase (GGDEF)-like protein